MESTISPSSEVKTFTRALKLVDHNYKKHCNCMIELNFAPGSGIRESQLEETDFQVTWNDGSTGTYKLFDLIRLELHEVCSIHSWASHGMERMEYINWMMEQFPELKTTASMAVYFYRKIQNSKP